MDPPVVALLPGDAPGRRPRPPGVHLPFPPTGLPEPTQALFCAAGRIPEPWSTCLPAGGGLATTFSLPLGHRGMMQSCASGCPRHSLAGGPRPTGCPSVTSPVRTVGSCASECRVVLEQDPETCTSTHTPGGLVARGWGHRLEQA